MQQKVTNRFGNPFGPTGFYSGMILIVIGIVTSILISLQGIILLIIGAFMALTFQSTELNTESKRIKYCTYLFGIFCFSKWIDVSSSMHLQIRRFSGSYSSYSRSNRRLTIKNTDYRAFLCDKKGAEIMPVIRSKSLNSLKEEARQLAVKLDINIE